VGVHFIVHRHFVAPLKAANGRPNGRANGRLARAKTWRLKAWRLEERRVTFVRTRLAFARIVTTTPHRPWVTEEALKARRPRHLLEDNPTSG
jgi:hypothetical protein